MVRAVQEKIRAILEGLQDRLNGARAVVFIGPNGVLDQVTADPSTEVETLANEYAMLLRIAVRTSEDAGAGSLVEHIVVSDRSTVIARKISHGHILIVLFQKQDQIGRARYELKTSAWELSQALESAAPAKRR